MPSRTSAYGVGRCGTAGGLAATLPLVEADAAASFFFEQLVTARLVPITIASPHPNPADLFWPPSRFTFIIASHINTMAL
jgi:hypothetical protein